MARPLFATDLAPCPSSSPAEPLPPGQAGSWSVARVRVAWGTRAAVGNHGPSTCAGWGAQEGGDMGWRLLLRPPHHRQVEGPRIHGPTLTSGLARRRGLGEEDRWGGAMDGEGPPATHPLLGRIHHPWSVAIRILDEIQWPCVSQTFRGDPILYRHSLA